MSTSAHLACPAHQLSIGLGKPLRDADGNLLRFAHAGDRFAEALWAFLEECGGDRLVLADSGDADFETIAEYREIGGWVEDGDVPIDDYLAGHPVEPVQYYGKLRPGYPRSAPSGIVRRRGEGPGVVDEAFTRNLRWEPTEYLRRHALGLDDTENVEITDAEAVDFALGVIASQLRPVWF